MIKTDIERLRAAALLRAIDEIVVDRQIESHLLSAATLMRSHNHDKYAAEEKRLTDMIAERSEDAIVSLFNALDLNLDAAEYTTDVEYDRLRQTLTADESATPAEVFVKTGRVWSDKEV